jgi:hypothetical protein
MEPVPGSELFPNCLAEMGAGVIVGEGHPDQTSM